MINTKFFAVLLLSSVTFLGPPVMASNGRGEHRTPGHGHDHRASGHAPIGVMGDHVHKKGEWMISYRLMRMGMEGSRDGERALSEVDIATTVPNRFFGSPTQPPTLRVVPQRMTTDMHMVGAMFGLSDRVTLLAMAPYLTKNMDHVTFSGLSGVDVLGSFTTRTEGLGDITIGALIASAARPGLHWNVSISLPTASIDESGMILTPANTRPRVRLPYAMQLGSGTVDLKPGLTYRTRANRVSWGVQANATIRLGTNSEAYRLGNRADVTGWIAYDWSPDLSTSLRARLSHQQSIDGRDENIAGPVQTADPDNYGGTIAALAIGTNYRFSRGPLAGTRLAFEAALPSYQDLHGPQLETDWTLTAGWQYAF